MKLQVPHMSFIFITLTLFALMGVNSAVYAQTLPLSISTEVDQLTVKQDGNVILTQVARSDFRPFLHPIIAPDGKGELTQNSPGHHKHQTGLYWGFTRVNGRDHFHHPGSGYYKHVAHRPLNTNGRTVSWLVIYDLMDAKGKPVMRETMTWSLTAYQASQPFNQPYYVLDLVWEGRANRAVTIGKYNYGGMFLRMPWHKSLKQYMLENSRGQHGPKMAEGKRAEWVNVGMQVPGRNERDGMGHMAMMDHPANAGYPNYWRTDRQYGIGPSYARMAPWQIARDHSKTFKHRILIYTGQFNPELVNAQFKAYTGKQLAVRKKPAKAGAQNTSPKPMGLNASPKPMGLESSPKPMGLELVVETIATARPEMQIAMIKGLLAGYEGQRRVAPPANWSRVQDRLLAHENQRLRDVAGRLAQLFGDQRALLEAETLLLNRKALLEKRRVALRSLVMQKHVLSPEIIACILEDPAIQTDGIRAFGQMGGSAKMLIDRYSAMSAASRAVVIETLATRQNYAAALVDAMKKGVISKRDVPTYLARTFKQMMGRRFTDIWGDVQGMSTDKKAEIAKYKKLLTDQFVNKGNAARGRMIFMRTCAACHIMFGEGGNMGPDITGSNRANLDYILYQIVNPNDEVPDSYKMVTLSLLDGQFIVGRITQEDDTRLTLQTPVAAKTVLKSQIKSRTVSPMSMMPEGLLNTMTRLEVRDLILYLRTEKQVPLLQSK